MLLNFVFHLWSFRDSLALSFTALSMCKHCPCFTTKLWFIIIFFAFFSSLRVSFLFLLRPLLHSSYAIKTVWPSCSGLWLQTHLSCGTRHGSCNCCSVKASLQENAQGTVEMTQQERTLTLLSSLCLHVSLFLTVTVLLILYYSRSASLIIIITIKYIQYCYCLMQLVYSRIIVIVVHE